MTFVSRCSSEPTWTSFIKHSKAPVTVLAVKDRVLAHNPLGVLYTARDPFSRMNTEREPRA